MAQTFTRRVADLFARYVYDFHLRGRLAPVRFARRVWRHGPAMRVALGGMLVLALIAGVAEELRPAAFLALCALAFGTAAAGAAAWGPLGLLALSPWLAYFGMVASSALATTPWRPLIAVPVWALLAAEWRACAGEGDRRRAVVAWLVAAFGAGWLTSGLSGFRAALGVPWQAGGPLLGAIFAALGALAFRAARGRLAKPPRFGTVLALTGLPMAAVLATSARLDPAGTVSWAAGYFPQLDFLVTLSWLWSGGGFALSLAKTADWGTRRAIRLGLARVLILGAPAIWTIAAAVELAVASGGAGGAEAGMIAEAHVAVTALALGVLVLWKLRGKLTARRVLALNTIWIVAFFALLALGSKAAGVIAGGGAKQSTGLAAAVAFAGVLGIVARAEKDWTATSDRHLGVYAAWAGTFLALTLADRLDPALSLDRQMAVQVFEGMVTLGLPLAIAGRAGVRVPVLVHLAWFVAGMLVGFAVMHGDPSDLRWLAAALPAWALLLAAARLVHRRWDRRAGAMGGAVLAAGTTLYWRLPAVFAVPFRPAIPSLETLTSWYASRPLPLSTDLAVTLTGVAAGALLGAIVFFRARVDPASARASSV